MLAPTPSDAEAAAQAELADAQQATGAVLDLTLNGSLRRGSLLEADVTASLPVGTLPFLGDIGQVTLRASARAPVDPYRSFPAP